MFFKSKTEKKTEVKKEPAKKTEAVKKAGAAKKPDEENIDGKPKKEIKRFQRNQVIFYGDEFADCMYSIIEGRVGIYINFGKPNERMVVSLNKGEYFGEMGVIESQPRSAAAVALDDETKLWRVTPANFTQYVEEHPGRVINILQSMGKRIHTAEANYSYACETIAEYMDLVERKRPKGEELMGRIKVLVNKGKASMARKKEET